MFNQAPKFSHVQWSGSNLLILNPHSNTLSLQSLAPGSHLP